MRKNLPVTNVETHLPENQFIYSRTDLKGQITEVNDAFCDVSGFTREEMLSRVWSDEVVVLDRTIDVNITRLRKKIGEYGRNIVTRLGYGYCFES